jgi:hypothetical protein
MAQFLNMRMAPDEARGGARPTRELAQILTIPPLPVSSPNSRPYELQFLPRSVSKLPRRTRGSIDDRVVQRTD